MYDGKKTTSEKIIYDALEKIKNKTKEDPIKVFNEAVITNIRPNLEVRSKKSWWSYLSSSTGSKIKKITNT